MSPTLILDLDGTLVDTVPALAASLNRLMDRLGLAPFSPAETAALVGDGAAALVRRALAARDRTTDEAAVARFLADYEAHVADGARVFPEAETTLRAMRAGGWRVAVCTNKPERMARALLAALGLSDLLAAVVGPEGTPAQKPDPRHLLAALAAAAGGRERAVMVGDHANDVRAAAAAGLPCIFAAWGYGRPCPAALGSAVTARRFGEVATIAAALVSAPRPAADQAPRQ